uniref:Potassium channel domain-containing protein n=1 Tax=Panagrolaimus sp. ES5 TaxID=591445 RepID=A0AC34FVD7_9BILA
MIFSWICCAGLKDCDPHNNKTELALLITEYCFTQADFDDRTVWNFPNAFLVAFGMITTLGYGILDPMTINGRVFAVIFGCLGIPITDEDIHDGESMAGGLAEVDGEVSLDGSEESSIDLLDDMEQISAPLLIGTVILYMALGGALIPYLNGSFDFFNGIYYSFLCLTAIEFGESVPRGNQQYIPIVIVYMSLGLTISTIALDLGAKYVRKLYFIGKKLKNIANAKIWFGSKDLSVKDVIQALGQNIGLDQAVLAEINLEQLISDAILVKEGKLSRVPQTHMLVEGIWPPELVPLFIKDGYFPGYADDDENNDEMEKKISPLTNLPPTLSLSNASRLTQFAANTGIPGAIRRASRKFSSGSARKGEKLTVRFEDVVYSNGDERDFEASSVQHINHKTLTDVDQTSALSDPSSMTSYARFLHSPSADSIDSKMVNSD